MKKFSDCSGVILAGGQSSRMGFPKESLRYKDKRVIDIILDIFHRLFEEVLIVTDDKHGLPEFKQAKVIEDIIHERGPLGGIYTALKTTSKDKAFFVACDMPLLQAELIKKFLGISTEDFECIVPYTQAGVEPLHAIYSTRTLPIIEDLLKAGDYSIRKLFERCRCKFIKVDKSESGAFFNVNTPGDLKSLNQDG
ncbi:MAG: molybdenum cofactor guanylyltransferase [Candidatus Omnitrophota bacterium]|jgi:molybdopterin-guanine dinucleotide biosynthesis protein A